MSDVVITKEELHNLLPVAIMVLGPIAAKYGIDAGTLGQVLTSVGGAVYAVCLMRGVAKRANAGASSDAGSDEDDGGGADAASGDEYNRD